MPIGPIVLLLIAIFVWTVYGRSQIRTAFQVVRKAMRWGIQRRYGVSSVDILEAENSETD